MKREPAKTYMYEYEHVRLSVTHTAHARTINWKEQLINWLGKGFHKIKLQASHSGPTMQYMYVGFVCYRVPLAQLETMGNIGAQLNNCHNNTLYLSQSAILISQYQQTEGKQDKNPVSVSTNIQLGAATNSHDRDHMHHRV